MINADLLPSSSAPVRRTSVRVMIVLWSVAILTLSMLAFGSVLRWQTERDILASVDGELTHFAHDNRPDHHPRDNGFGGDKGGPQPGGFNEGRPEWQEQEPPPNERRPRLPRYGPDNGPPRGPKGSNAPPSDGARIQPVWRREFLPSGIARSLPAFAPPDSSGYTAGVPWDDKAFQAATLEKRDVFSTVVLDTIGPLRVLTFPAPANENHPAEIVQMARPLRDLEFALNRLTSTLITLIAPFLVFAAVGGAFLASRVLRPVRDMARAASTIEAENLSGSLPVSGGDEFAVLAQTFNAMLTRLHGSFERQKRFTSDASHELRTPLAVIRAHTSLVLQSQTERTPEQYRKTLQTIDKAAQTATRLVQDLLLLARADTDKLEMHRAPIRISDVLLEAVRAVEIASPAPFAPITLDVPDTTLAAWGDEHYLLRLVINLVENAVRHTPSNGQVRVSAQKGDDTDQILLTVEDTGEGIAPEHLAHVCERFYRVDDSRARQSGGSGLGLALCQNIVEAHGGTLRMESTIGKGTRVLVSLPAPPFGSLS